MGEVGHPPQTGGVPPPGAGAERVGPMHLGPLETGHLAQLTHHPEGMPMTSDDVIFTGDFTGPLSRLVTVLGHVQRGAMSLHLQAGPDEPEDEGDREISNPWEKAWSHGSYDNPARRHSLLPPLLN
jgi:hypothetical protein